jgi:hypothetical protein
MRKRWEPEQTTGWVWPMIVAAGFLGLVLARQEGWADVEPSKKPAPTASASPNPVISGVPVGGLPEWIAIDGAIPGTRVSYYTEKLPRLLKKWPPKYVPHPIPSDRPMWIRPVRTPDSPNYIGVVKKFLVKAPLARVEYVIEDMEKLPEILDDVKEIKVVLRSGNKIVSQWERYSPAFFIPNTKYEMIHIFDKKNYAPRHVYRYQLRDGNHLNYTDGLIVLEPDGKNDKQTWITHFDFFDANFGPFRALAEGAIWGKSVEGSFRADMRVRLRMESADLSASVIQEMVERLEQQFPVGMPEALNGIDGDIPLVAPSASKPGNSSPSPEKSAAPSPSP